jgi:hypothetical protein
MPLDPTPLPRPQPSNDLRSVLETLDPKARDDLRRVLIHDQDDRDAVSSWLLRYRDQNGQDWSEIIDMLTMRPEARTSETGLGRQSR